MAVAITPTTVDTDICPVMAEMIGAQSVDVTTLSSAKAGKDETAIRPVATGRVPYFFKERYNFTLNSPF
jgi:hypothetical protein